MPRHRRSHPGRTRIAASETGFTLIELLVVITILGILAAIVVFAVNGIGDKGRSAAVSADAAALRAAEETNCAQHDGYEDLAGLHANKLIASAKAINAISLGSDGKCGTGAKSSFTIYDPNAPTNVVKDAVPVVDTPYDVAVDPDTNRIYVTSETTDSMSVIDGTDDSVIDTITGLGVHGQAQVFVNPANDKIYVAAAATSSR